MSPLPSMRAPLPSAAAVHSPASRTPTFGCTSQYIALPSGEKSTAVTSASASVRQAAAAPADGATTISGPPMASPLPVVSRNAMFSPAGSMSPYGARPDHVHDVIIACAGCQMRSSQCVAPPSSHAGRRGQMPS